MMRRGIIKGLIPAMLAAGFVTEIVSAADPQLGQFEEAIGRKFAIKRRAYQTANAEIMRDEYYSKNAVIYAQDLKAVGAAAIYETYRKAFPIRKDIAIGKPQLGVSSDGTLGYALIVVKVLFKNSSDVKIATLLLLWKRENDDWRCFLEAEVPGDQASHTFGKLPASP